MHRLLIGGELVAGDGPQLPVENPADERVLATIGAASPEQVDAAVAAAADAAPSCSTRSQPGCAPARTSWPT